MLYSWNPYQAGNSQIIRETWKERRLTTTPVTTSRLLPCRMNGRFDVRLQTQLGARDIFLCTSYSLETSIYSTKTCCCIHQWRLNHLVHLCFISKYSQNLKISSVPISSLDLAFFSLLETQIQAKFLIKQKPFFKPVAKSQKITKLNSTNLVSRNPSTRRNPPLPDHHLKNQPPKSNTHITRTPRFPISVTKNLKSNLNSGKRRSSPPITQP